MGSAKKVKAPADPDPTPIVHSAPTEEIQGAARAERKRIAKNYGRQKTILAGNTSSENAAKKTILGG